MEIRILKIVPKTIGTNFNLPGKEFPTIGALAPEFPDGHVEFFKLDVKNKRVDVGSGIVLPLRPFPGTLAVGIDSRRSVAAQGRFEGPHGPGEHHPALEERLQHGHQRAAGRLDHLHPVFLKGGLIWTGDSHCLQGNGEVNLTALECSYEEIRLQPSCART